MKSFTKSIICLLIPLFFHLTLSAQYEINPVEGYTPQIGTLVAMLEDLKARLTADVQELSQEEIDFLFDENANSIAALLMHIISTEAYYQVETLEGWSWSAEDEARFGLGGQLGAETREELKDKPVSYYLDLWEEVRTKTLEGLQAKDDEWLASNIEEGINNHWVWFHVLEHTAGHMGQISLVKNRLLK